MSEFKVGDKVQAKFNAWSKILNGPYHGRRIEHQHSNGILCEYEVVAIGCKIPIDMGNTANTLLVSWDYSPEIFIAINNCNLAPYVADVSIQFVMAGEDVTEKLSRASKREILQAHLRNPRA